jgi:hypothetical protein
MKVLKFQRIGLKIRLEGPQKTKKKVKLRPKVHLKSRTGKH